MAHSKKDKPRSRNDGRLSEARLALARSVSAARYEEDVMRLRERILEVETENAELGRERDRLMRENRELKRKFRRIRGIVPAEEHIIDGGGTGREVDGNELLDILSDVGYTDDVVFIPRSVLEGIDEDADAEKLRRALAGDEEGNGNHEE